MNEINYLLSVMLVMTLATYVTRLAPFLLFSKGHNNLWLSYIAKSTPPMVMTILVVYMLKDVEYLTIEIVYTIVSLIVICVLHLYKRNALLSIVGGTAVYMIFVQNLA
tara:strand:- start:203 stop:526 length:324 start_codon:yes stop_codon:yes gene_type:complete